MLKTIIISTTIYSPPNGIARGGKSRKYSSKLETETTGNGAMLIFHHKFGNLDVVNK
jgi:hypothetical protein